MTNTLTPLQEKGVKFLLTPTPGGKPHKLLAYAPGVGKTPITCEAIRQGGIKSGIIICPDSPRVKKQWVDHLVEWAGVPKQNIHVVANTTDDIPTPSITPFVIVGYACVRSNRIFRQLYTYRVDCVVVDEARRLKALDSKTSDKILGNGNNALIARGFWKWLLDGTIVPNRPLELYPMLRALAPEVIHPHLELDQFGKRWCGGKDKNGNYTGASNMDELSKRLSAFMLSCTLEQAIPGFDQIQILEQDIFVDIGDLPSGADETNTPTPTLRREIGIAKAPYVAEYCEYMRGRNAGKMVVFFYHREVGKYLSEKLSDSALYIGGMTAAQKESALTAFINGSADILLAQLNAAGEAIDGLQNVSKTAILAEPDWSDGGYDQMLGRLRRYGQTQPIDAILIITKNYGLEKRIVQTRRRKHKNIQQIMLSTRVETDNTKTEREIEMVLEESILKLAAAMDRQAAATEALLAHQGIGGAPVVTEVKTGKAAKEKAKETVTTPPADSTPQPTAPPATADEVRSAAKNALLKMGNTDESRNKIKDVMKHFGVDKLENLDAKHFTAAITMYNALENGTAPSADDVI